MGERDGDADLVEALRRDDPAAADRLVEQYGDRVYRLAMRITGVTEEAEQVAADALWTAASEIETLGRQSALGPWLRRLTVDAAQAKLRARRPDTNEIAFADVLPPLDGDGQHWDTVEDWSRRVNDETGAAGLGSAVTDAIEALPPDYRTALVLHDVEGMSPDDVAGILAVTPLTVKSRVHRARLLVRHRLSDHLAAA